MNCLVLPLLMMLYCLMQGIQKHQIGKTVTLYYCPSKALLILLLPLQYCMTSVAMFHCHYHLWNLCDLKLSNTSNLIDIFPAPGSGHKAKMVSSRSSDTPHFFHALQLGQYVCDSNCLKWNLLKIVHT